MINFFHDLVDSTAMLHADRTAIRYRGTDLTYAELRDLSLQTANGLYTLGVRSGDRVAIFVGNKPETVEIALACSRLGAIFIPLNPMLRSRQLTHILDDSQPRVVIASQDLSHQITEALDTIAGRPVLVCIDAPTDSASNPISGIFLAELRTNESHPRHYAVDRDPAAILYTSGSTGRAKGVVLSHANLVSGAKIVSAYLANTHEDRILAALPLSFDYGLSQVTTSLLVGACCILTNFSFPAALIQEILLERVTGLAGVPAMWTQLARLEWPPGTTSLRYITNSGGALSPSLINLLRSRLPYARIYCMYGLTEAFRSTFLAPEELDCRAGSIGKALEDQEMLILREDGTPSEVGEPGELVHRGTLVSLGYWNDPEGTRARFRPFPPGATAHPQQEYAVWSGDLVRADAEGFLYFVGRKDDLIKTSGYRVSPTEIEEIAAEIPEVVESVAVGIADEMTGQRIVLAIVASTPDGAQTIEKVMKHCRVHLPPYMVPTEIILIEKIPRTVTGKPNRGDTAKLLDGIRSAIRPAEQDGSCSTSSRRYLRA